MRKSHKDDNFLHATMDRLTAIRYAHWGGTGSHTLLMLDLDRISEVALCSTSPRMQADNGTASA